MTFVGWGVVALVVLALLGLAGYGFRLFKDKYQRGDNPAPQQQPDASLSEILCLRHTIPPKELHAPHYNQVRCQRQIGTAANFSQAT